MIDLTGNRFGRLEVLSRDGSLRKEAAWRCVCDCGKQIVTRGYSLRSGNTQSCGCLHSEVSSKIYGALKRTHGQSKTPAYVSWGRMHYRCTDRRYHAYQHYGGRGIKVCERWQQFENFLADMGERPAGKTLDRINVDGDYEPGNCRWATAAEQAQNKRKVH